MMLIVLLAVVLTLVVLFFAVYMPKIEDQTLDSIDDSIRIHRQQISDLTYQFEQGELTQANYEPMLNEAKKALLADSKPKPQRLQKSPFAWYVWPLMTSVCVAVVFFVYDRIGAQPSLQVKQQFERLAHSESIEPQKVISALNDFQALLEQQPENLEGWYQLSQMQLEIQHYEAAVESLQRVLVLLRSGDHNAEDEASVLAYLGQSYLALQAYEKALDVLQQSLALSSNPVVLGLAGQAAFEVSQYVQAIDYWERLKVQYSSSDVSILEKLIVRAKAQLQQQGTSYEQLAKAKLQVHIKLPKAWQGLPETARLFVYARPEGERMPLLAKRLIVNQQNMQVVLSQADAIRAVVLEDYQTLELSAKVSLTGTADAQPGDWTAQPKVVSLENGSTKNLKINLSLIQPTSFKSEP